MKHLLLRILIAHVAASYAMYLVEDIRLYSSHMQIEPGWTIGAPIFAPLALGYFTFLSLHPQNESTWMTVRLWLPYLLVGGAVWYFLKRFAKKHSDGHCESCGYDLRATPERCPECGTVPPAAKIAAAK